MSHWSGRLNMLWQKTQRIGSDSMFLMSKLAKSPSSSRDILLSQARQANSAATSFLRVEREISLVRYHGFWGYLRERNVLPISVFASQKLGFGTAPSLEKNEGARSKSTGTTARVAFMITSAQRTTLSDDLGYTADQIKSLKPVEASLILENNILPADMVSSLPSLVEEYHNSLAAAQPQVEEISTAAPSSGEEESSQHTSDAQSDEEGPMLSLPPGDNGASVENTRLWYQVVEVKPDATDSVGLYPNESEAKLCLETKEHLAAKHTPDEQIRFEIRKTRK